MRHLPATLLGDQLLGYDKPQAETRYFSREEVGTGGHHMACQQRLAEEVAVAISYNGLSHAVMMATPEHLEDYAVGFSVSSGIVTNQKEILDITIEYHRGAVCVEITLIQRALHSLKCSRRAMAGSSGCGLCGIEALDQILTQHGKRSKQSHSPLPPASHLKGLRERFQRIQRHRSQSGAMHAALYVDTEGTTLLCREDIGRHNALDKLLGASLLRGLALHTGFVAVTSRCGLELVQKAVCAGVGTLVSLSSPSDISVRWARDHQLNLLHQPTQDSDRIYSPAPKSVEEPR